MKAIQKLWNKRFIGLLLIFASGSIYYLQVVLFHDTKNTLFYLFQDLAFVPLQVAIVTLILEQILSAREKSEIRRKLNVVIGAFYSEVGTQAIASMSAYVNDIESLQEILKVNANWKEDDFKTAVKKINAYPFNIHSENSDLNVLRDFLFTKKAFILSLFENTNLLEHDTFTDMLWAVFHLLEELDSRDGLDSLPDKDLEHLSVDIKRAYKLLVIEWLYYMIHLKKEYPYLYSLAVRKSPFSKNASVIIE